MMFSMLRFFLFCYAAIISLTCCHTICRRYAFDAAATLRYTLTLHMIQRRPLDTLIRFRRFGYDDYFRHMPLLFSAALTIFFATIRHMIAFIAAMMLTPLMP